MTPRMSRAFSKLDRHQDGLTEHEVRREADALWDAAEIVLNIFGAKARVTHTDLEELGQRARDTEQGLHRKNATADG